MADIILQITDGTTTINLDDTGDYLVNASWRPAIATRRPGVMGNQLPWNDVIESIPIEITGTDIDDLIASETALINLIDQAQRWQDGENVAAVIFKYRSQDSTITNPLQSTILGTSGPALSYSGSPEYGIANTTLTHRATLTFRRLGVWLGDAETQTSASVTHTQLATDTFTGDADIASPVFVRPIGFTGSDDGADPLGSNVFVGITDESDKVDILNSSAASVISVPGSGTFNVTATIRRQLVPNSAGTYTLGYAITLDETNESRPHVIFLKVQNLSDTIAYNVFVQSYTLDTDSIVGQSRQVTIPASANSNNPYVLGFPLFFHRGEFTGALLNFIPDGTGGSGEALNVGDFVVQVLEETSQITSIDGINKELSTAHDGGLLIRHDLLGESSNGGNPIVYETYGGGWIGATFTQGLIMSRGTSISAYMIGTTGSDWEIINGSAGGTHTDVSSTFQFIRRLSYLVPQ